MSCAITGFALISCYCRIIIITIRFFFAITATASTSAATATGLMSRHLAQLQAFLDEAFAA